MTSLWAEALNALPLGLSVAPAGWGVEGTEPFRWLLPTGALLTKHTKGKNKWEMSLKHTHSRNQYQQATNWCSPTFGSGTGGAERESVSFLLF